MRKLVPIFLVALVFLLGWIGIVGIQAQEGETITLVWREDTGQYYTKDIFSILLGHLGDLGVTIKSYNASVLFAENKTIETNYFGDPKTTVLVIPNPPQNFTLAELEFIKSFVESGGGLILMSDVQYNGRHYGKPDYLNSVLRYLGVAENVSFWGTNSNGDEIKDNVNNLKYPWQVVVTSEYFAATVVAAGIEKVVINAQSLNVSDDKYILATSPSSAYAEDSTGQTHAVGKIPWLAAVNVSEGKVILCGSSKMFSDNPPYSLSVPYIQQGDNEQLFFNMLWYLTGKKFVAPEPPPYIGFTDIFAIIAGLLGAVLIRSKDGKLDYTKLGYVSVIVGVLFAIPAVIQVALFGQVIAGSALPDWGQIAKASGQEVPTEVSALLKYFMAGVVMFFVGVFIIIVLEAIDNYLALGIMEKLGVKRAEPGEELAEKPIGEEVSPGVEGENNQGGE